MVVRTYTNYIEQNNKKYYYFCIANYITLKCCEMQNKMQKLC